MRPVNIPWEMPGDGTILEVARQHISGNQRWRTPSAGVMGKTDARFRLDLVNGMVGGGMAAQQVGPPPGRSAGDFVLRGGKVYRRSLPGHTHSARLMVTPQRAVLLQRFHRPADEFLKELGPPPILPAPVSDSQSGSVKWCRVTYDSHIRHQATQDGAVLAVQGCFIPTVGGGLDALHSQRTGGGILTGLGSGGRKSAPASAPPVTGQSGILPFVWPSWLPFPPVIVGVIALQPGGCSSRSPKKTAVENGRMLRH